MSLRFILQFSSFILLLLAAIGSNAQSTTPSPAAVNVAAIPSIEIVTIVYEPSRNVFRANFDFINESSLGGLRIKVENSRTNTLALSSNYAVINAVEISANTLQRGESYILTVTGLDIAGQVLRLAIPQSFGDPVISSIEAQREFQFSEAAAMEIAFSRSEMDTEFNRLNLTLNLSNAEDARNFSIWLEGDGNLIASEIFTFRAPLNFPMPIPMDGMATGKYRLVVEAFNADGDLLASAQGEEFNFTAPVCDLVCMMSENMLLLVIVALIVGLLIILLLFSLFRKEPEEYPVKPVFHSAGALINDQDVSLYTRNMIGASNVYLVLETGDNTLSARVPVQNNPFAVGSKQGNHLLLNHPQISGNHALISQRGGKYYLRDANSLNGTKLNGKKLSAGKDYELQNGSRIYFAKYVYRVEIQANSKS